MERHPLRLSYLVTGIVFIAVAILGLTEALRFRAVELAWAGPGLLVVVGIALVVGTAMGGDDPDAQVPTSDDASDDAIDEPAPQS